MTERWGACPDDHRLVELALGDLTGRDRAAVLTHLSGCRTCRDHVDALVRVCDEILLAAPESEPPVGFETAVIDQIAPRSWMRRRRPHIGTLIGVACAAALVLVVAVVVLATSRGTKEFGKATMVAANGQAVGSAWRYDGDPSWVLVSVPDWAVWKDPTRNPNDYELRVELDDGSAVGLGAITFAGDSRSWGTTTTVDTSRIRSVAIVDHAGQVRCSATFDA